jgi:hypothetical protein
MTLVDRTALAILRRITTMLWGRPPLLLPEIVDHLGGAGALGWFAKNLPRYESLMKAWGPVRVHLLCTAASLLNACSYCVYAHGYALELHFFQQEGRLFPIDEHEIVALRKLDDAALRDRWKDTLAQAGLAGEGPLFDRLWKIRFEGAPDGDEIDAGIRHLLRMFEMLNFCGVKGQTPFDHAHDPINKDGELKSRYAEARLARGGPHP